MAKLILNGNLKKLLVASNYDITPFGWKDLLGSISQSKSSLTSLDISSNPIGRHGVVTGSPLLAIAGATLDYVNLSGCQLSNEHAEHLAEKCSVQNTKIKQLKMTPGNDLDDGPMKRLITACT